MFPTNVAIVSCAGMRHLNGASELGSQVRVEPAKESFLDRLKRERASHSSYQPSTPYHDKPRREQSHEFRRNERNYSLATEDVPLEETRTGRKRKSVQFGEEVSQFEEEPAPYHDKKKRKSREEVSSEGNTECSKVEEEISSSPKKKNKNKVEEEILSSFKSFSSVWGDSDAEEDGEDTSNLARKKHKKGRYGIYCCHVIYCCLCQIAEGRKIIGITVV